MTYIGIDPGLGGGIAALAEDGTVRLAVRMPATERDLIDTLDGICESGFSRAILELVRSSPQMGVVSAWRFGVGYGGIRMALVACGIPFDEVVPRKWQDALGCRTGGNKNISKRRGQELFPGVKVTHALADSLLIAEYARRLHCGLLTTTGR